MRAVYIKRAVAAVPRDAARVIAAAASVASLYFRTFSEPAAPVTVVTLPLLVATPGVLSFDVLLEDARFLLAVVICVWTNR